MPQPELLVLTFCINPLPFFLGTQPELLPEKRVGQRPHVRLLLIVGGAAMPAFDILPIIDDRRGVFGLLLQAESRVKSGQKNTEKGY